MVIRDAIIGDELKLAKVHVDTWLSTYKGLVSDDFLNELDYLTSAHKWKEIICEKENILLVAENEKGIIIGYAFGGENRNNKNEYDGEMYALYILNTFQRKGIGKLLMQSFMKKLVCNGYKKMIVWVLNGNSSCRFYETLGGQQKDEKVILINGINYTATSYAWEKLI